jgi:8-oxo-dGTP diphosphatase
MSKMTGRTKHNSGQRDLYAIPIDNFFKSAFSVDCVIFGYHDAELKILLIQRGADPFEGYWALPGDLVYPEQELDTAASKVLQQLTSIDSVEMKQVHTFGKVDRHPLGRVITVGYMALVEITEITPMASNWAKQTKWHSLKRLPKLAFDHKEILDASLDRLKTLLIEEPIWAQVLPKRFTITQFQSVFETILDRKFDKGNFRKKIQGMKFLSKSKEIQQNVRHRPSQLYEFDSKSYHKHKESGFQMNL